MARRVYYTVLALIVASIGVSPVRAGAAEPVVTVNPSMVRGDPAAPVTIVEFSDYQ